MAFAHGPRTRAWRATRVGYSRRLALSLMAGLCLVILAAGRPLQAQQRGLTHTSFLPIVSTAPPPFSTSYYMESANPDFFGKLGCAAAVELGQQRISAGVVVLFLGQPAYEADSGYGTLLLGRFNSFVSTAEIQAAAVRWVDGYLNGYDNGVFRCQPPLGERPLLTLALATNNQPLSIQIPVVNSQDDATVIDPDPDMASHGYAWASLVNYLNYYAAKRDPQQRLSIAGANDIELAWNTPQQTKLWVNGYLALAKHRYYNVGSCDGCAEREADAPASGPYAFGWTAADIWEVSAQGLTHVLPQMYNESGAQARQWATLSNVTASRGVISFAGALTQYYACEDRKGKDPCKQVKNRPAVGWQQFDQTLKDQRINIRLLLSTDVRWKFDEEPFHRGGTP